MGPFRWNPIAVTMSQVGDSRNDEWNSDRPKDESQGYDGPAGMEPDGVIDSNWDEVCENFDDMNLKEELLRGIYAYGFEKPSAIQQRAIVPCIKGLDVIAQAQSGTGKTATFSIAILEKIDTGLRECQALILAPTRELAQQIQGGHEPWRLHGRTVPRVHWWNFSQGGHEEVGCGPAHRCRHPWPCL